MRHMLSIPRSLASAFFVAGLCLQSVFGPVAAQAKYAPFRFIYLSSQSTESVAARLAAQNALFKEQFDDDMRASPESETARGDYRDNAMLDDYSLAASTKQNATDRAYRAKLAAISAEGFPEQDRISHDLLLHVLDNRIADYELKNYEMPISQMQGIHNSLADLPNSVPLDTVRHYEDYIARLHQIPRAFEQTIEVLRQGEKDGLMPVRILLEQIPAQCEGTITENPFLAPTKKFPASISAEDQKRLTAEIVEVVDSEVLPAYRRFAEFIEKDYAPRGRSTIGLNSLPDGARRYQQAIREQTTTDMSPAEIHALGLSEVGRINGLLSNLALKAGYKDLSSFRAAINGDAKYIPKSADQIVEDFRRYVGQMQPHLPELFGVFPKTPLTVEPAPASQPNNPTHYVFGTPDGSRPARVVVATSNYAHRKLVSDETQAYHEGIPGHHMQISIQQGLTGLPEFRLHVLNNAYAEGWAVYAEALGKEIGFFQDPGLRLWTAESGVDASGAAWWSIREFTPKVGRASRPWLTSARAVPETSPRFKLKLTGILLGRLRGLATRSASSRFSTCAIAPSSGLVPTSISEPSTMKSWAEEACRSTCWKPGSRTGLEVSFRMALPDKAVRGYSGFPTRASSARFQNALASRSPQTQAATRSRLWVSSKSEAMAATNTNQNGVATSWNPKPG